MGYSFPGCRRHYYDYHQHQQQHQMSCSSMGGGEEHHQRVHRVEQGDVVAMPAAAQRWLYNDGEEGEPLVAVYVFDTHGGANQLEPSMRKFLLAGGFPEGQLYFAENVFRGIDADLLAEALGVSAAVAARVQSRGDRRGEIVRVDHGLQLTAMQPQAAEHHYWQQHYCPQQQQSAAGSSSRSTNNNNNNNNVVCTMELRYSVDKDQLHLLHEDDMYSPGVGWVTRLDAQKFPVLGLIQMTAVRVHLNQNAILSPFWNLHAHSAMYAIQGRARIQVASDNGTTVFDAVLRAGQFLIVPQNYVVAGKAKHGGAGFGYISFETSPNAAASHMAGRDSVLRDLPLDVIAATYAVSREDAMALKNNRKHEHCVFAPPPPAAAMS